jgi:hypothetical protein
MARSFNVLVVAALAAAGLASGCASWEQPDDEVWRRPSGAKLQPWRGIGEASALFLPYAWASVAAYQDNDDPQRNPLQVSPACPEPHAYLRAQGWVLWETLPLLARMDSERAEYRDAGQRMRLAHLRAEVWAHAQRQEVIVAFGGTAASSWQDWKSNLHWLGQFAGTQDEYAVLSEVFAPIFIEEYLRRRDREGETWLKGARVLATGHSLGGGLAQRFAYTSWFRTEVPRATTVFAFDPSPVSGKRSTPGFVEDGLAYKGLEINRIYNRGEILAGVRSLLSWGNPNPDLNENGQVWIDYRYRDGWTWRTVLLPGSIHAHAMYELACFMKEKASLPFS